MTKRTFSGIASKAAKAVQNDRPKEDHEESKYCGDHGCRLRADLFVGGPGSCLYHHLGRSANRNPSSITDRINFNIDKLQSIAMVQRAPLKLINGVVRGTQTVPGEKPDTKENIQIIYPYWLPIGDEESHHEWLDRARKFVINEIVGGAEKSRFSE